jgi:hypothetical protein
LAHGDLVPVGKAYSGGIAPARPLGAQQYRAALRAGARGGAGDCPRGRVRQRASLDPSQVGTGDALSAIHRIRWDKPVGEADAIEVLEKLLA